jgi:hypothetical protein
LLYNLLSIHTKPKGFEQGSRSNTHFRLQFDCAAAQRPGARHFQKLSTNSAARVIRVDVQKIHQPILFDSDETSYISVNIGYEDSSAAKAIRPDLSLRTLRSPGCDLFRRVVARANLAHRASEAAPDRLEVTVDVIPDHDLS